MFLFLFFYFEPLPHPFFFFLLKKKNHLHHQDTTVSHQLSWSKGCWKYLLKGLTGQLWVPGGDLPCIGKPSCTNILPELSDQLARVHASLLINCSWFDKVNVKGFNRETLWCTSRHPGGHTCHTQIGCMLVVNSYYYFFLVGWIGADQLVEHLYSSLRLLGEFEMTILTHCPKDGHTFHRPLATYNVYLFPEIGVYLTFIQAQKKN